MKITKNKLIPKKYSTEYFENFQYSGSPFGLLPKLILVEPESGNIIFDTFNGKHTLSLIILSAEFLNFGGIRKVVEPQEGKKYSIVFKHTSNDNTMRNFLFGFESIVFFPSTSTNRLAITGIWETDEFNVYADIENSSGQTKTLLGTVTNEFNTLEIEFLNSSINFILNGTVTNISDAHSNFPVFSLGYPDLEFTVFRNTNSGASNPILITDLKEETKND